MHPVNTAPERALDFATGFLMRLISVNDDPVDDILDGTENDRFISNVIDEILEVCMIQVHN